MRLDKPVGPPTKPDRTPARLYVSGIRMDEGPLEQINSRFEQECAGHSAPVEVRVIEEQQERTIRRRVLQRTN